MPMNILCYALYFLFVGINGISLYRLCRGFAAVRENRWAKLLLFVTFTLTSGMVIWVGDNNLAMTFPFFIGAFLAATQGDSLGRLTVGGIFFCFIMAINAIADTYLVPLDRFGWYDVAARMVRPLAFVFFCFLFQRKMPQEPVQLPHRLWKLCAGLASLPLVTLSAIVLPAYWMPDSVLLHDLNWFQGAMVLPMALLASVILLISILVLADYEKKARAAAFSELREVYYQGLQREQTQVRTLRHDLRNHLNTVLGLLERGETEQASRYLRELADSQALHRSRRVCENEIANVVVSAKREEMEERGLEADLQIALPAALSIADTDLCALLGNALDNAMEAAEKAWDKRITVQCRADKGLLMLRVKNALAGDEHADWSTTKKDRTCHGFGLTGMREIAARYGGSLEYGARDGSFELIVCLPLEAAPGK